ncbi:MAG: DUF2905 domain-containing protein [Bdellovibrionales bacterium]|nr:DUF2905 domain-containing protein [Bdellovibrionales bacterium]
MGKLLIGAGTILVIVGVFFVYADKIPFLNILGRLPGDIHIEKPGFSFHFPLATSILLSLVLSFIVWLVSRP